MVKNSAFQAANANIFGMENTLDWSQIDTVLLDMDGTVLDLAFDNYYWLHRLPTEWGALRGLNKEQAMRELLPHFEANRGSLNWYCLDYWSELLDFDVVGLKAACRDRVAILEGAFDFLQAVRASQRRLLLVTNAHPAGVEIKLAQTGIAPQFDAIVSTHSFGRPKEDPLFWQAFAEEHEVALGRSLFVDDSESVLAGAKAGGVNQLCGIMAPDSGVPPRAAFADCLSIYGLRDLTPALTAA